MEDEKRNRLIDSAKKEFVQHGFQKASLRAIASNASMTTGAIYFYFRDKADLFDTLVEEVALKAQRLIEDSARKEKSQIKHEDILEEYFSLNLGRNLINLYFDYPFEVQLLFQCSDGSNYAHFDRLLEKYIQDRIQLLVEEKIGQKGRIFTKNMISWLAHTEVEGFLYAVSLNLSREETLVMVDGIVAYLMAGFNHLYRLEKRRMFKNQ